jgi:hypothetical protein
MDELITKLVEKLGISENTARKAILITAHYLKTKLPQNIYPEVELVLEMSDITEEEARELGLFQYP